MTSNTHPTWITGTQDALRLAVNVSDTENAKADLESAAGSLPELVQGYRAMAKAASVVRPLGWEGRSLPPDVRNYLRQAAESLENRKVAMALRGLERFRGEAKTDLMGFWHEYADSRIGNVPELLVFTGILSAVDGLGVLCQRLASVLRDLIRVQDQLPSEGSSELLSEVESALEDLEGSLQPDSVRRFLSTAARGGASVELLTNDVIEWLRAHNAIQGFKIVAGAPPESPND
jgi:hypothetical protein